MIKRKKYNGPIGISRTELLDELNKSLSPRMVANTLGVSHVTVHKYMQHYKIRKEASYV